MKDILSIDKSLSTKDKLEQLKNIEMDKSIAVQAIVLANVMKDLEAQAKAYLAENYGVFDKVADESSGFTIKKVDRATKIYDNEELESLERSIFELKADVKELKSKLQKEGDYSEQISSYYQIDKSE